MANSGKKSSGTKKKSSSAKTSTTKTGSKSGKVTFEPSPVRREVGGILFFCLAFFTLLGYFGVRALFIDLFCGGVKGFIGWGFFALAPALILAGFILVTHGGRPVKLRVWCALLLPLVIGCIAHLFACDVAFSGGFKTVIEMFETGRNLESGGLISGLVALLFKTVFSKIGAAVLFIAAAVGLLIMALNMTISSIYRAIKDRPRLEYEEPEEEKPDTAAAIVEKAVTMKAAAIEKKAEKKKAVIDIPVDEGPLVQKQEEKVSRPKPEKSSLFNDKPNVKTPDSLLVERLPAVSPDTEQLRIPDPENKPVREYRSVRDQRAESGTQPDIIASKDKADIIPPAPVVEPVVVPPAEPVKPVEQVKQEEKPVEKIKKADVEQASAEVEKEISTAAASAVQYHYPPLELLASGDGTTVDGTDEMRINSARLADTLRSFGIDAKIVNVTRGPSVTRYELEIGEGVRLNKITNLSDDIALKLGAQGVRIAAIPDRISVVGIEVPNKALSTVYLRNVIDSAEFKNSKSAVAFALGMDIGGSHIVADISKMPHLLVAGATGYGKSVCINSIIISLLYKSSPDDLRLIMVDPKMVELVVYNGLPHLLIPVVTDPKKAAGALQWAVTEMMRRYALMAEMGVRNLAGYNKAIENDETREKLPNIVIIIDELADLMMVAAKEVEDSICRITQMARAAGMHLIIATQRPSADVITGVMKANIPSRIAFYVDSAMNSRIILDASGAEKLVGKGDMLFKYAGGKPQRIQGCFVTDEEIESVVDYIKKGSTASYSDEIMEHIEKNAENTGKSSSAASAPAVIEESKSDDDELLPAAVEVILETGQASTSMLQRRLKLGYARAARIVDAMEEKGIVGPFEGSKPRRILITKEQWQQMQMGAPMTLPLDEENDEVFDEEFEDEAPF